MEIILINALLAGIGISLCASSIGCFVIWQRMSYFGDSLSHSILLGIILGVCFNLSPIIGGLLFAIIIAFFISFLDSKHSEDSILGIVAQSSLAIVIILNSFFKNFKLDLNQYLFGDILATSNLDIIQIYIIFALNLSWMVFRWKSLMLIIISKDLAYTENINVRRIKFELILIIAILITFSIKIVGALLINALLMIPACSVKILCRSPKQMVFYSNILSFSSMIIGITTSLYIDTPTSATIVVINFIFFIIINIIFNFYKNRRFK